MNNDVKTKETTMDNTQLIAIVEHQLPAPAEQIDPSQEPEAIAKRMAEIDIHSTQTIIRFGSKAQDDLQQISETMLQGVRSKDLGPAGESLREMVSALRGFSLDELDPNFKPSFWQRIFGGGKASVANFIAQYEDVQDHIDSVTTKLDAHEQTLLKDIKYLDALYEKTLDFYHELAIYIAAGEAKLHALDTVDIPQKMAEVENAAPDEAVLKAQELRDLRAARDDLDRRVHDLKLTRQVTMQSLPSIRLVQENDKSLVTKIHSTMVNTVPLWKTQLAQAITIQRSREAAGSVKAANDLTNELLTSNAQNLRAANTEIREEMERGVFDIESIKTAQAELIGTIEDSLRIADEGKRKRAEAEMAMITLESELKTALASAKAREENPASGKTAAPQAKTGSEAADAEGGDGGE